MTEKLKRKILTKRIQCRLGGVPFFMVGDTVRIVRNTHDGLLFSQLIGKLAKIVYIIPSLPDRMGGLSLMPYGLCFFDYGSSLHRLDQYHSFKGIENGHGWWADGQALELVKRVEEEE